MKKNRSLFFDTSFIYFVVIACFVLLRIFSNLVKVGSAVSAIFSILIQVVFMLAIPFFMYKILRHKKSKELFHDFNIKKINAKAILIAIGIGVVVYFLNLAVASFFNAFIVSVGYDPSFGLASTDANSYSAMAFLSDIILTAVLPGICEEFCHRGLLVNGYKQIGAKKTIFLVGLLFGLMHLNIEQFFYATVIGMFLTFLVYVSGSIIPSIIVHFLNNFLGLYFTFASYNNLPFGNFSKSLGKALSGNALTVFGTILLIVFVLLGLLVFLTFLLLKNTRVKEFKSIAQKAIANKERENLLKSFDLNIDEVNAEQGINNSYDSSDIHAVVSEEFVSNGKKSMVIDFSVPDDSLMAKNLKKPSLKDKSFLYGIVFIGVFITISTLIWGII